MSDDWIEEAALEFEGFNTQQIAQLKTALPKLQILLALARQNQSDINQSTILVKEILPVLHEVLPKIQTLIGLVDKNQNTINQADTLIQELIPTLNLVISKIKDRLS